MSMLPRPPSINKSRNRKKSLPKRIIHMTPWTIVYTRPMMLVMKSMTCRQIWRSLNVLGRPSRLGLEIMGNMSNLHGDKIAKIVKVRRFYRIVLWMSTKFSINASWKQKPYPRLPRRNEGSRCKRKRKSQLSQNSSKSKTKKTKIPRKIFKTTWAIEDWTKMLQ